MNSTCGKHLLIEASTESSLLGNSAFLIDFFTNCIQIVGATLLFYHLQTFQPSGISGVFILAESHLSFHTWPEKGYMSIDFYTCGQIDPTKSLHLIQKVLEAKLFVSLIDRGIEEDDKKKYSHRFEWQRDLS